MRKFTFIDNLIMAADAAIKTITNNLPPETRLNPASSYDDTDLTAAERKEIVGLMRVNHAGEISAQALYQGQALVARSEKVKSRLQRSAMEENDHLHWTKGRLQELNGQPSYLNPIWYVGSFCIGAGAGLIGDKWSLGFLAETEHQVMRHLKDHMQKIPGKDKKSHAILEQMYTDESHHAHVAVDNGAAELPYPVKKVMNLMSKVMTKTAYWV